MNGRIKIFSKANLLDQKMKMSLVLIITVLLSIVLNNTFILGEMAYRFYSFPVAYGDLAKAVFFTVTGFASYFALAPFTFGRDIWFYENAKRNRGPLKKLFSFYSVKKSPGVLKLFLTMTAVKTLSFIVFLTPSAALGGYLFFALSQGTGLFMLLALVLSFILLFVTGLFFYFVYTQKFFLVPYLFYENPTDKVSEMISLSGKIMENKCFDTAIFKLSFFPWWLLCVLLFPAVYVYPYYKMSISLKVLSLLTNS